MRGRTPWAPWSVPLTLALAGLAVWRSTCILAGPDLDTDAYAHHMIARAILADPHDLAVHWVWLPLFHYLQVPLVALGGTMNDVRWLNSALVAGLSVAVFAYVARSIDDAETERPDPGPTRASVVPAGVTAFLAAVFTAACPIVMQMGTTAQPEPLFALVVFAVAVAFERRRYALAAALLGAAVLLRYESWASLAAVAAIAAVEPAWRKHRGLAPEPGAQRAWVVAAVPVALILGWALLRRPVDGRWFGFLGQTHDFASQVAGANGGSRGFVGVARDVLYYPVFVAIRVLGPVAVLAVIGVTRTVRQQGARFVLVLAACLGFVSLTWVNRSSLGLDRHFVVVVPLYATFAAQGIATLADAIVRFGRRLDAKRAATLRIVARVAAGVLAVGTTAGLAAMLVVWMGFWRTSIARGWPERASLAAYLRTLPPAATIFCDDATLEILSDLDRHRFDRHWVDDPETWNRIADVARAEGVTYVATWRRKFQGHEHAGTFVFLAADSAAPARPDRALAPPDPTGGVAVLRVPPDSGRAAR